MSGREHEPIEPHDGRWAGEHWAFRQRTPRARKDYGCDACGEDISRGTRHVMYVTTNQEAPGFEAWRIHGECHLEGLSRLNAEPRPPWRWLGPETGRTMKGRR